MDVSAVSGTDWHIQFRQFFNMTAGLIYTLNFTACATQSANISFYIQQVNGNNTVYYTRSVPLTTTPATFAFTYPAAAATGNTAMTFILGAVPAGTSVWLDNISLQESAPSQ